MKIMKLPFALLHGTPSPMSGIGDVSRCHTPRRATNGHAQCLETP